MEDGEMAAQEVDVVGSMFPGPDGEPPADLVAASAALRKGLSASFSLRLPLPLENVAAEDGSEGTEVVVELSCTVPPDYPARPPTQLAVREGAQPKGQRNGSGPILSRSAADKLQADLALHLDEHCPPGEPRLFEAIRWLQENAAASFAWTTTTSVSSVESGDNKQERHWLWSHHIYGKKKRRSMLEWSSELRLRGACLPGKPGLIVVEGDAERVREFVRRVRVLPWKRMIIKLIEELPTKTAGTDGVDGGSFPAYKEVTFDGFKDILEHLHMEHRLGEVLGLHKHTQAAE